MGRHDPLTLRISFLLLESEHGLERGETATFTAKVDVEVNSISVQSVRCGERWLHFLGSEGSITEHSPQNWGAGGWGAESAEGHSQAGQGAECRLAAEGT